MKIENLTRLVAKLQRMERESARKDNASVQVGYATNYALFVHEDLTARHPVGQAKYLEQPAREGAGDIARIVRAEYDRSKDLGEALVAGGLYLQRESQLLVPVDTSNLKNSAFVTLERGAVPPSDEGG